jgi:hypothetical protein
VGRFYEDDDNMADLVDQMSDDDRARYANYGHNRIEPCFADRIFIVYKPSGLNAAKQHMNPEIVTTITVLDFSVNSRDGATVRVRDDNFGGEQTLTYVPKRLFTYQVFASIPPRLMVRWDAHEANGKLERSLGFALLLKTRNRAEFYSKGNTYIETPNKFRSFYPSVTGDQKFKF